MRRGQAVFICYSEHDIYGESRRFVEQRFPGPRRVVIPNAGHVPWLHNPGVFYQQLQQFYGGGSARPKEP